MNIDSIILSEYASFVGTTRLTIIGTLNRTTVPSVPVRLPPIYMSLVIEAHPDQAGSEHEVEIRILNQRRERVGNAMKVSFRFADEPPLPGMHPRHSLIMAITSEFPEEGPYAYEVFIDGTYYASTNFYVEVAHDQEEA